jgi:hypothetical protein
MKVYSRAEFVKYWNSIKFGLGNSNSGLWAYEQAHKFKSQHFICVKSITINDGDEFIQWVKDNCSGRVSCYSSNGNDEEWWGFTDESDIMIWILRWA